MENQKEWNMDNVIETGCTQGCIDNALHDSIAILFYWGSKPTILVVFCASGVGFLRTIDSIYFHGYKRL